MQSRALRVVSTMSVLLLSSLVGAQDVDVPGNLTMRNSTDPPVGNVLKEGVPFLHNFGAANTFLGANAGNFTMSGYENTATGYVALQANTTGGDNTTTGAGALFSNTEGSANTATGFEALHDNITGTGNTASGYRPLRANTTGINNTASGTRALIGNIAGSENTATGYQALYSNTTGSDNTATGAGALFYNINSGNTATGTNALFNNTIGNGNTAIGDAALGSNTTGSHNTAIGSGADVPFPTNLTNATAIGYGAIVDASNKVRVGNAGVTVIEGQVGFTASSDRNKKENFKAVDGEKVLGKIRGLSLTSWNFIGHDPKQFRHYGPMAQDFFTAFGDDGIGKIGTETTITSTDIDGILMVAANALEKRTVEQRKRMDVLTAENADLKARLEALERRAGSEVAAEARAGF